MPLRRFTSTVEGEELSKGLTLKAISNSVSGDEIDTNCLRF